MVPIIPLKHPKCGHRYMILSIPTQIIFKLIYLIHRWNPNGFYHSGSELMREYDNEEVLHTPRSSRTGASQVDAF